MIEKCYDWTCRWVWGDQWHVTDGVKILKTYRSGTICHTHAMLRALLASKETGAFLDYPRTKGETTLWIYKNL